eukprot:GEMP01029203.1.p1 GENE.GEMP01029203.1~~GEMP01029203.1.p1  ORF type:complete len:104 (+),score=16.30 GEMP01029203.1:89-400(+)
MWPILDPVVEVLRVDVTVSLCRVHGLTSLMCVVIGLGKVEQRKVEKDRKAEAISFPAVTIASAYPPPGIPLPSNVSARSDLAKRVCNIFKQIGSNSNAALPQQ